MSLAPEIVWLEEILFDSPTLAPLRSLHPLIRIPLVAYQAADMVATPLADYALKEGGIGALDLFTPEIRRYEETALVGLGGMII